MQITIEDKKKIIVFWGTGNVSAKLDESEFPVKPHVYMDNSIERSKQHFLGREIWHPSQVKSWKSLFIIIAVDNYTSIKKQLETYGLISQVNFAWYRDLLLHRDVDEIVKQAEQFINSIGEQADSLNNHKIIFSSYPFFDKGIYDFMNDWEKRTPGFLLMSEAPWMNQGDLVKKINYPVIALPDILGKDIYIKKEHHIVIDEKYWQYVNEKKYLIQAADNLRMRYQDMCDGYEFLICYFADLIVKEVITKLSPKEILIWNAFYAFHMIVRNICEERKIPIRYMEFGNIPGTICVEGMGQMGESYPARYVKEFRSISVSKQEFERTSRLLDQLYQTKKNRNVQPQNDLLQSIRKKIEAGRPTILYAGQNDNASGMQPYTENTKKYHSPIFRSSDDAAVYLADICEKKDWNLIYKPHPMMAEVFHPEKIPDHVMVVDEVNINDLIDEVDVVVTILSTVSYVALIRGKPVVMLGYTQLKGKGCTYEAFDMEKITETLQLAINKGFTGDMRKNFIIHTAQMLTYTKQTGGEPSESGI